MRVCTHSTHVLNFKASMLQDLLKWTYCSPTFDGWSVLKGFIKIVRLESLESAPNPMFRGDKI